MLYEVSSFFGQARRRDEEQTERKQIAVNRHRLEKYGNLKHKTKTFKNTGGVKST